MNKLISLLKQADEDKLELVTSMCSLMLLFVFVASCVVGFWKLSAFMCGALGTIIMFFCIHWCIKKLLLKTKELILRKFN